ncbi:MAG: HAD family phosphatase [Rhodobacteraceae bacterium]|nr:HAD family phosphatase [Paracoccaceae bacterium]
MTPKAVLFDCDGVLVDSEPQAETVILGRLAAIGLDLTPADLKEMFLGGTMRGIAEQAAAMGADVPEDWIDLTYEALFASLREGVPPIVGAHQVLDALDANRIPYAVGSNGPPAKMDITLAKTGLLERFSGRIYSGHVHGRPKPEPDIYLRAASDLGIGPEHCTVVEDSATGARAAARAGMRCIGFAAAGGAEKLLAEGAEIAMTMAEVRVRLGL